MLVDERTLALASGVSRILPERTERLKTELFECVVETTTTVCESAAQALEELRSLRHEVGRRARRAGLDLHAAGTHPFSRGADQEIVPEERYLKMKAELGPAIYRQIVCGLHVHVGMPDPETCLRAFEGVLRWLPEILSLSANSPYLEGEEAGVASGRAGRLAELPRAEAPPVFRSWADWEAFTAGPRLHEDVVGRSPASAARNARGPDRRPADRRTALGSDRGARPGARGRGGGDGPGDRRPGRVPPATPRGRGRRAAARRAGRRGPGRGPQPRHVGGGGGAPRDVRGGRTAACSRSRGRCARGRGGRRGAHGT